MAKLYNTTKKLLDKIAEKRSDVEVISKEKIEVVGLKDWSKTEIYLANNFSAKKIEGDLDWSKGHQNYFTLDTIPAITTDTLLDLLPKLFGEVDNPAYDQEVEALDDMYEQFGSECPHCGSDFTTPLSPDKLGKALIQKYFTDGMWRKDQVAVLEDVIKNIDLYL